MNKYFRESQSEMFSFYRVPKILFQHENYKGLSAEAKILYGLLLDRMDLSAKNNWLDKDGHVFIIFTVEEVMEKLGCGNKKAIQLLSELEAKGRLIERHRQGLGKPNLIYVLNFMRVVENYSDEHFQKCQNDTSVDVKTTVLEASKRHGINTENNYTENNDTDSFYSYENEVEGRQIYKRYYEYFRESLEMDILEADTSLDTDELRGILEILVEVCSSQRSMVRINREEMPADIVKSRLMKLTSEHIRYVLLTLGKNTTKIRDTKQYMLSALFNAPVTMSTYYKNWVAHNSHVGTV